MNQISLKLPDWFEPWLRKAPASIPGRTERMQFVLAAALENVRRKTGGPFAAAIFEQESGRLVAAGVNSVVANCCSSAHAEVMALSLAQQQLGAYDLGGANFAAHELVGSADPCAMCCGAISWSGIRSLVTSAPGSVVEEVTGFDEGPIRADWTVELERRGIAVTRGFMVEEGRAVLEEYKRLGLPVYNGRQGC